MPNKAPKANKVTANGVEDQPSVVQLSGSDPDGSVAFYRFASLPTNGTLYLDVNRTQLASANVAYVSNTFYFVPDPNFSGTASFTYSVIDNLGAASPGAPSTISVAAVNDAPLVDLNGANAGTSAVVDFDPTGPAVKIAPLATILDIDSTNFYGGRLKVSVSQNGNAGDHLSIATDTSVTVSKGSVFVGGLKVGSIDAGPPGSNGAELAITLTNNATSSAIATLVQHITYSSSSPGSTNSTRGLTISLNDGDGVTNGGADTGSASVTVNVTVDHAPNVGGPVHGNATEDAAPVTLDALANAVDPDGDPLSIVNLPNLLPAGVTRSGTPIEIGDFAAVSIPDFSTDGQTHADFDQVWSVSTPPFPININLGIGYLINPYVPPSSFSMHDHQYIAPHVPDPSVAVVTFQFTQPVIVDSLDVVEHRNGVTELHGYVGNSLGSLTDIGAVFGSLGDLTGFDQMFDGQHNFFDFNNTIAGTYFQVVIDKTSHIDGYALMRMFPQTAGPNITLDPSNAAYQYLGSGEHTTVTVNYGVSDGSATTPAALSWTIAGVNDAPVSQPIASQTVDEGDAFLFSLPAETFTDADANDTLTYAATLTNGDALPGWLSFDAETQTFTGTPGNSEVGSVDIRVTGTDSQSSQAFSDFTLTVNDAPTSASLIGLAADQNAWM